MNCLKFNSTLNNPKRVDTRLNHTTNQNFGLFLFSVCCPPEQLNLHNNKFFTLCMFFTPTLAGELLQDSSVTAGFLGCIWPFSVFWPISTMLFSKRFQVFLWFSTFSAFFKSFGDHSLHTNCHRSPTDLPMLLLLLSYEVNIVPWKILRCFIGNFF